MHHLFKLQFYLQPGSAGIQAVQGLQSLGVQGGQLIVAGSPVQPPAIQNNPSVVTITLPGTGQTAPSESDVVFLCSLLPLYKGCTSILICCMIKHY